LKVYKDMIKFWIVTTSELFKIRENIMFLPFIYISKFKDIAKQYFKF
jgi:hypothetical protein